MKKLLFIILFFLVASYANCQYYESLVMYAPTYENEVASANTSIRIDEKKNIITLYNATYEGEVTNLKVDSIKTMYWTFEQGDIKTYFCTDTDDWRPKIRVLDLIQKKNTIKLIYLWDEISIEEYSFVIKN